MSSRSSRPDAPPPKEIPDVIFDPNRPNRKYERGKFLGKVRMEEDFKGVRGPWGEGRFE